MAVTVGPIGTAPAPTTPGDRRIDLTTGTVWRADGTAWRGDAHLYDDVIAALLAEPTSQSHSAVGGTSVTYATTTELADVNAAAESAGTSNTAARGDHKHSVATAAPVALAGSTQAAGTSTSLARADHQHGLPSIPQANITDLVWQSYTPTLTNFAGTINWARYRIIGKSCRVQVAVTLSAAPTGRMEIEPPVAAASGAPSGNLLPVGVVVGDDVGTARRHGAAFILVTGRIGFGTGDAVNFWGVTTPHTWAASDTVAFNAEYELA